MFISAARKRNQNISVIQYIPPAAIQRKTAIEKKLKNLREHDPSLRTQVRLGKDDLQVMIKHVKAGVYSYYVPAMMKTIDPANTFPPIKFKGKEINPEDAEFIARAAAAASKTSTDSEGYQTVTSKTSPVRKYREKRKREDTPEKICQKLARIINGDRIIDDEDNESEDEELMSDTSEEPAVQMPFAMNTESRAEENQQSKPVLANTALVN